MSYEASVVGLCTLDNSSLCDADCGAGRGKGSHGRVAFGSEGWVMFEQNGDGVSYWGARGSGERSSSLALAKRYAELAFICISYIYIFFFISEHPFSEHRRTSHKLFKVLMALGFVGILKKENVL